MVPTLSTEIRPFQKLSHLVLSGNNLGRRHRAPRENGSASPSSASYGVFQPKPFKDPGAFRQMFSLTHLWLDNNNLTLIGKNVFRDLTSLVYLNLEGNFLGPGTVIDM